LVEFLSYQLPPLEAAGIGFEGWISQQRKDLVGCGAHLGHRLIGESAEAAAYGQHGQQ
jgi:hypothetical protein